MLPEGVVIRRNGLELPKGLTDTDWQDIGARLGAASAGVLFMWGDFFAYAETHFQHRPAKEGKRTLAAGVYDEWAPRSGFDAATLRNAKYVCQAVPLSRRREGVTFSQLCEIVGRADKGQIDQWQERVVQEGLTVRSLRMHLKVAYAKHSDTAVAPASTFLNDVQEFVEQYLRARAGWHPRFKREVAKAILPVYRDLESHLREM